MYRTFELQFGGRRQGEDDPSSPEGIRGVYIISVAARILEMHPQTLRKYERAGLVSPSRTGGKLRLYSEIDIARLRLIKHLVNEVGLNLAGVELVLDVFNRLVATKVQIQETETSKLRTVLDSSIDEIIQRLYTQKA
jgi:MerR family transcriptional regulator/heat shock protein HspR